MSMVVALADAVAAELNSAPSESFGLAFTTQRRVLPVYELEQLAEMKVTVVPKRVVITGATRSTRQYELNIDIGIQQKLPPGDTDLDSAVVTLGTLVDQIADYLCRRPLSQMPEAAWVSMANEPVYAPDHLAEQRVFTSVLTLTYRLLR